MKSQSNGYPKLTIYMICIIHMFASIQLCEGSSKEEGNERILSRRRRYLIFPEGSSIQFVYDTYQPVIDYTNLLVVGITGALAWELPSKPVYLESELQEIYKNGSLPLLRRHDEDSENRQDDNNRREPFGATDGHNSFDQKGQSMHTTTPKIFDYSSNKFKHYLSYINDAVNRENFNTNRYKKLKKFFPHSPPQFYGSHQYRRPMFGKRSTSRDVMLTAEEKFNLKHHRKSRHTFYKQLEKFIDTTGHDGQDCILKALCETGQNKEGEEPRSFIGEILKAVFSLPDLKLIEQNTPKELYDLAHTETTNCTEKYLKCSKTLWKTTLH